MFNLSNPHTVKAASQAMIAKPVEEVFRYIGDGFVENYPKWAPEVERVEALDLLPLQPGSQLRQVRIEQGQRVESTFQCLACARDEHLAFAGVSDPYECRYECRADADSPATNLTFTFHLQELQLFMRPFEKLIRVAIEDGARQTVTNIKALLEDGELPVGAPTR